MKNKEWMLGIAISSYKCNEYNRCSKCCRIFDVGDRCHTKLDELDYNLCDDCFNYKENNVIV